MKYTAFHEKQFHGLVNKALHSVRQILDANRNPRIAEDMEHTYDDKYALAEFLTNTSIAAQLNILERMGMSEAKLKHLVEIVQNEKRAVTLCFEAEESCTFLKEQMVDVVQHESQHNVERDASKTSSLFYGSTTTQKETSSIKHQVVQKVREYHWKIASQYRVYFYDRNDPLKNHNSIDLLARTASTTITTTGSREAPFPQHTKHKPIYHDFSWVLRQIKKEEETGERVCCFEIDRTKETCFTPRRNDDIDDALYFFDTLSSWFSKIREYFIKHVEGDVLSKHEPANPINDCVAPELSSITDARIFVPVLPLMEPNRNNEFGGASTQGLPKSLLVLRSPSGDSTSPLLSLGDIGFFLNEQRRTMGESMTTLTAIFPSHQLMKLVTVAEASLVLFSSSATSLFNQYQQSIEYIEEMLRAQLVTAIGKEIQPDYFNQFVMFHNNKIFADQLKPKPFSYAVRRPNHYPDGMLSIEYKTTNDTKKMEPIHTHTKLVSGAEAPSLSIPINSSTTVEMVGDRYLHGWMNHRFESASIGTYTLSARARQFSSFLLMVGVLGGANKFEPKDAIIVQNKDEILIPLLLKELPSAKEFKDSISSLSPEQQRFATAFRSMQLESSVFAVCVVQIKPQLELLLGLPENSLTKEIKLTQNLLSLFVQYQIPSDLLTFEGPEETSKVNKIHAVKKYVSSVMDVISETKKSELEEMEQKAQLEKNKLEAEKRFEEVRKRISSTQGAGPPLPPGQMHHPLSAALASGVSAPLSEEIAAAVSVELVGGADVIDDMNNAPVSRSTHASNYSPPSLFRTEGLDKGTTSAPITAGEGETSLDFTNIPKQLDSIFEQNDPDGSIRATTIETQLPWIRLRQEGLLSGNFQKKKPTATKLDDEMCGYETDKAFDLLDALTRSGTLPLEFAELHVVVAMTHCFENDVMGSVIQDNINPIEKVERSVFMVAGTIHGAAESDWSNNATLEKMISEGPHRQRIIKSMNSLPLLANSENIGEETAA